MYICSCVLSHISNDLTFRKQLIELEVATSNSISNFNINIACSGQCTMYVAIYWKQMVVRICSYCSYITIFISYNATIAANNVVAQLFLYRTWTALHHAVGDKVESKTVVDSYFIPKFPVALTMHVTGFLLSKATIYATQGAGKSTIIYMCVN